MYFTKASFVGLFIAVCAALYAISEAGYGGHGGGHGGHDQGWGGHYHPYGFGYDVEDGWGNKQWRHEKGSGPWNVHGSYGYKDGWGVYREVHYVADKGGFRAQVRTNEPGTAPRDPADVKMDAHPQPAGHGHGGGHGGGHGHGHGHGHGGHGGGY